MAVVNILLFGLGNSFTNQTFNGHAVNGETGTVISDGAGGATTSTSNAWYTIAWIVLFAALIASVCQFTSNIFMTKFSKRFIWFNQISMGIWLVIDALYGVWWIMLTQIAGLMIAQWRFIQWDKQDKDDTIDPFESQLNLKYIVGTFVGLVAFFVIGMLLITTVASCHQKEFYKYEDFYLSISFNPDFLKLAPALSDKLDSIIKLIGGQAEGTAGWWLVQHGASYDEKAGVITLINVESVPIAITDKVGPLYDSAPWFDLTAGVFQIGGLLVVNKKSWIAWAMWEVAEIGMIVSFAKAGNLIMVVQNILLFVSNLIPLSYWMLMNHKSAQRVKKGLPFKVEAKAEVKE